MHGLVIAADWGDVEVLASLLDQVEGDISQVSGGGAYDAKGNHAAIAARGANTTIPPRDGVVPWDNDHPREPILDKIAVKSTGEWRKDSGYHRRSVDVIFGEDARRMSEDNAPQNFSLLTKLPLNLPRQQPRPENRKSLRLRRKRIGWDDDAHMTLLGFAPLCYSSALTLTAGRITPKSGR